MIKVHGFNSLHQLCDHSVGLGFCSSVGSVQGFILLNVVLCYETLLHRVTRWTWRRDESVALNNNYYILFSLVTLVVCCWFYY